MGNIPIQYVLFDRSFRNDRWGIFNLCDPYIRIWRRLWSVCFYLNMTLFLAYASMFPEMEVYLYMILPIKVKWLGYLDGLYLIYIFLSSGFTVAGISVKVSIVAALLNFLLFFFSMKKIRRMGANFKAKTIHKKKARAYKAKTITPKKKNGAMHECAVCHRTELDDPELEFRYCSKCDGNYEYCQDHLFTHKHVKR